MDNREKGDCCMQKAITKRKEKQDPARKAIRLKARQKNIEYWKSNWQPYLLILPVIIYFVLFKYMPLYGIQIAFKDYKITTGIWESKWVGFDHFERFFDAYYFERLLSNTFLLNIFWLLCSFPVPIILALLLNRIRKHRVKRIIQTTIYVPYFISTIVLAGMLYIFLSPSSGLLNIIREAMGMKAVDWMSDAGAFRGIYIISGIWQTAGYSSILYIATLTSIDQEMYEAAEIDGTNIWQKIWYIDIPSVIPTAVMILILDIGKLMSTDTTKVLALQTPGNIPTSDILGVYVHNVGLGQGLFSYTTAIGLFINVINFVLVISANKISKKLSNTSLF